jgi:coenzyme F420 hydrogenase subunit beta
MTDSLSGRNVVARVVRRDRCSGCGGCAGVCPEDALTMAETPGGDLAARWAAGPCASDCGLCAEVCPFDSGVFDPRSLNAEAFGPREGALAPLRHEDTGFFLGAYSGYSQAHRPASASGGLLTWTLERLFETGRIDRATIVACEPGDPGGIRFMFREASTIEEVRRGAGSVYHQVDLSAALKQWAREPGLRRAVTGVPCLCAALRRAMLSVPSVGRSVRFVLGLACGMLQNRFYTEMLCLASGVHPKDAVDVRYRLKAASGSAANYDFRAAVGEGRRGRKIAYSGLPYFLSANAYFRLNACNFCKDVFAEAADACFMDAWLPRFIEDRRGTSLVLVRHPDILRLFESEREEGAPLAPVSAEELAQSQAGQVRRKRVEIAYRLEEASRPDDPDGRRYRARWRAERRIQRRSKAVWAQWGRRGLLRAFLLSLGLPRPHRIFRHWAVPFIRNRRAFVRAGRGRGGGA